MHSLRRQLAEAVFNVPPDHITVRAPDVGGGFGPEWVLVRWAARRLSRPVGGDDAARPRSPGSDGAGACRAGMLLPRDHVMRALGLEPPGRVLEQGDWSLLDAVRGRKRMWRDVDGTGK